MNGFALGLLAILALTASAASGRETLKWGESHRFTDDMWAIGDLPSETLGAFGDVGQRSEAIIYRRELLASNAADISANKAIDVTGHAMSVSGLVVAERFAFDVVGMTAILADSSVVGEQVFDQEGTHDWALLPPEASPYARWLPIRVYRFEGEGPPMYVEALAPLSVPEPASWALMMLGFAGLSLMSPASDRHFLAFLRDRLYAPVFRKTGCAMDLWQTRRLNLSGGCAAPQPLVRGARAMKIFTAESLP